MLGMRIAAAAAYGHLMLPSAGAAQATLTSAEAAVAVSTSQVVIGEPDRRITLVIWQPGHPGVSAGGRASTIGASGDAQRLPLVVISHGTGAGPAAHIDTAQALAAAGFVVAAPMHPGDNFQDSSGVGKPAWMADRSRDISIVIDYMLQQWSGRAQVDGDRVGIFGFSAGATTALIAAGGVPDLDRIAKHCAAQPEFVCNIMSPPAEGAAPPPPRWTHDRRVSAAVFAAPGLGFSFEPAGLSAVNVPVQLWVGGADQTVPYATNAGVVRRLLGGPVEFHTVENAVHLSFLAPCGPDTPPRLCADNPGFDRAGFHRSFNQQVTMFFQRHLSRSPR
jgi:predicted dienelactone hydrolase